jgi:hypothetical protein
MAFSFRLCLYKYHLSCPTTRAWLPGAEDSSLFGVRRKTLQFQGNERRGNFYFRADIDDLINTLLKGLVLQKVK